jgi:hypothetical protein
MKKTKAALAVTLALSGCGVHRTTAGLEPQRYPAGEAAAVYRATLDALYGFDEQPPFVVLYDSTQLRISDCPKNKCRLLPEHTSEIERSTLRDFDRVTLRHRIPLRSDFGFRYRIELVGDDDWKAFIALGEQIQQSVRDRVRPDQMPFWVGFARKYPGAWGITSLSSVGFNSRQTQALLQVHHGSDYSTSWEDFLLEKQSGNWRVLERMLIREGSSEQIRVVTIHMKDSADDYQILSPLRYLGNNAHMRADFFRRQDSTRRARDDSLALERAPTRIRGTVTNAKTGLPFRGALVISHNPPNDLKHRTVTDSAGNFVFNNLRGGTMLEVRCPGAPDNGMFTLAAPGFYAHAAIDTVVQISVPDLGPCWGSHHLRPLQAGWIESAEAREARYPSGAAAQVYRAALDAILPRSPQYQGQVILSRQTSPQCVLYAECGGPQLRRLIAEGVVKEETARDFVSENRYSRIIRPTFEYRRPIKMMTNEDSAFLSQQGQWLYRIDYNGDHFWPAFRDAFPGSPGIVSLSRVGFNRDSTQALLEARLDSADRYDRPFQMLLLERKGSEWRIARRHIEREVTSGDYRGRRCIPVAAPANPVSAKNVSKLHGDYLVTEIVTSRNDTAAQRIHIRIVSGAKVRNVEVISDLTEKVDPKFAGALYLSKDGAQIALMAPPNGLDGYVNDLHILRVENGRFYGSWKASLGNFFQVDSERRILPNPSGYFCATSVPM